MGKPKKRTSARRTGTRRSHLIIKLARAVNAKSPVKAFTTRREAGKTLSAKVKAPSKAAKLAARTTEKPKKTAPAQAKTTKKAA